MRIVARRNLQVISSKSKQTIVGSEGLYSPKITSFSELSQNERRRLERIVEVVTPRAGIIGEWSSPRTWDLRPVVVLPHENTDLEQTAVDTPTIIRLLGPEVTISMQITTRVAELFKRLSSLGHIHALNSWGVLDGQLWYRRFLYRKTLAERIAEDEPFTFAETLDIALKLLEMVEESSKRGVIHGHLTPENVAMLDDYTFRLLDTGVAVAVVQANAVLEMEEFPRGYFEDSFAPEILSNTAIAPENDLFGLGKVFFALFSKALRHEGTPLDPSCARMYPTDLRIIRDLVQQLISHNATERPTIDQIRQVLLERKKERGIEKNNQIDNQQQQDIPSVANNSAHSSPAHSNSAPEPNKVEELRNITQIVPAIDIEEVAPQIYPTFKEQQNNPVLYLKYIVPGLLVLLLLSRFIFSGDEEDEQSDVPQAKVQSVQQMQEQLKSQWASGIPSDMSEVAMLALGSEDSPQRKSAERIIITSAIKNTQSSGDVNYDLLRYAFDGRWESKLRPIDRRVALTIALARLVQHKLPDEEQPDLGQLHPGVILALSATLGREGAKYLSKIPAKVLLQLPPPFNLALTEIIKDNPNLSCGDPFTQSIAKFELRGLSSAEEVIQFLSEDTDNRLRAIARLFSFKPDTAKQLIAILIDHPNLKLPHPEIEWGRKYKLSSWKDLESNDQLFILAGIPPTVNVSVLEAIQILAHPSSEMRRLGISKVLDKLPLHHPASVEILNIVKEDPTILTPRQTLELASFLERPEKVKGEAVDSWLATDPSPALLSHILTAGVATDGVAADSPANTMTLFDEKIATYLSIKNWIPSSEVLPKLIDHPLKLARLIAYKAISQLPVEEKESAIKLINRALEHEQDAQFKEQLQSMLAARS
jgi:hypothetical protein